jgi:hypothetical protein
MTKELLMNAALAFVAAFLGSLATAFAAFDRFPDTTVLWALLVASVYAGARAVIGYFALKANTPIRVDK